MSQLRTTRRRCGAWIGIALLAVMVWGVNAQAAVEITWWQAWTNSQSTKAFLEDTVAAFEEANPGIKVNLEYIVWNQIAEKAAVAIAAGAPPDVVMLLPIDYVSFAHEGLLTPLGDRLEADGISLDLFLPADGAKASYQGEVYGLPHISGGASNFLIINVDSFEESGLAAVPPETWGELKSAAEKLTRRSGGQVDRLGLGVEWLWYYNFLLSNSSSLISADGRSPAFGSDRGVEALRFILELQDAVGGPEVISAFQGQYGASDSQANFPIYQGRLAMRRGYQALFKHINNVAPNFRYAVGVSPYNERNPDAAGHGYADGGWYLAVPAGLSPETVDAAYKWIKWMTVNEDGGATFPMIQGRPAPLWDVNYREEYFDTNPAWEQVIRVLETDVAPVLTPVHTDVLNEVTTAVQSVYNREAAPETALEQAEQLVQSILDEFYANN